MKINLKQIIVIVLSWVSWWFKGDLFCFSLFPVIYIMLQCWIFILNVAKVSNNEVNVCKSNPCEQKAQVSDCSEHQVFKGFFLILHQLTSARRGCLNMVICSSHSSPPSMNFNKGLKTNKKKTPEKLLLWMVCELTNQSRQEAGPS